MNDSSGAEDRPNEKTGAQPGTPAAARLPGAVARTRQARSPCVPAAEQGCWGGPAPGARATQSTKWEVAAKGETALFPGFSIDGLRAFPVQTSERAAAPHLRRDLAEARAVARWRAWSSSPALWVPLAESAQPCPRPGPRPGGADHPLSPVRAAAQRTGEVPGRSFPLRRGPPGPFPGLAL